MVAEIIGEILGKIGRTEPADEKIEIVAKIIEEIIVETEETASLEEKIEIPDCEACKVKIEKIMNRECDPTN